MLNYIVIFCIGLMAGLGLAFYNDYIQRRLYVSTLMYLKIALLDILYSVEQNEKDIGQVHRKVESYIIFIDKRLDDFKKIREEIENSIKNCAQEDKR